MTSLLSYRINHLRACAALWVYVFHFTHFIARAYFEPLASVNPFKVIAYYGYTGVSLFFCLSGFLFAQVYCDKSQLDVFAYYGKRLLRIIPGFAVLMLVYYLCLNDAQDSLITLLGKIFSVDVSVYPQSIGHLWSINRELQCYALFPLLWLMQRKFNTLLLFMLALMVLGLTLLWAYSARPLLPYFYGAFGLRWCEFILGMLLGIYFAILPKFRWQLPGFLLLYLLLLSYVHAQSWENPLAFSLMGIAWLCVNSLFCLLFIYAYLWHKEFLPKSIYWLLEKIGETSYSFYLYHFLIVMWFAQHRDWLVNNQAVDFLLLLGISQFIAFASYHLVEMPALKLKRYL